MNRVRRTFNQGTAAALLGSLCGAQARSAAPSPRWRMPDEADAHRRTWMSFGASVRIWGERLLPTVHENLGLIAATIAEFEPVSMLVRPKEMKLAREVCGNKVQLVACPVDDLWIRDSGCVFVTTSEGDRAAVDFNFNGWGGKQTHAADRAVARFMATQAGIPRLQTWLVLEGGGIEVDGEGTAIITESCVLNANRNPGRSRTSVELELRRLLGLERIIWLPGLRGHEITDGHTDFYARFTSPGVVVAHLDNDRDSPDHAVTRHHLAILRSARDAAGRKLQVVPIETPTSPRAMTRGDEACTGYINFYVCNGGLLVPEFGDHRADEAARKTLAELFAGREVVPLNIDGIAAGGGGIHCATQQEPG